MTEREQLAIFSANLRNYLYQTGKSQLEVAKAINVSQQAFNSWCRGIAIPRMGKLESLANYFGINKSDLLDKHSDKEESDYSVEVAEMINNIKRDTQLRRVLTYYVGLSQENKDLYEKLLSNMKGDNK